MSQENAPVPTAERLPLADDKGLQDVLTAEFNYIAQATVQNNEDRVSGFFWISAAAIVGAAVGLRLDATTPAWVFEVFAVAFGLFVLLGWLAILQLAQLRASWFSCIQAMNRIKAYYYAQNPTAREFRLPGEAAANAGVFLWMQEPRRFKPLSIGLLRGLSIALIDGAFAVASTLFFYLSKEPRLLQTSGDLSDALWRGVLSGVVIAGLQVWTYALAVRRD